MKLFANKLKSPVFSLSEWIGCRSACITNHQKPLSLRLQKKCFAIDVIVFWYFWEFLPFFVLVILRWEQMSERTGSRSFRRIHEYLWVKRSVVLQSFQLFTSFFFGKRKQTRNSLWHFDILYKNHPSKNPSKKNIRLAKKSNFQWI